MFVLALAIVLNISACFAEDGQFVRGELTLSSYENEAIGIRCDVPDTYVMATEEEIEQIMTSGVEKNYKDDEAGKQLLDIAGITLVYEMLAVNSENNSSILILAEKPMRSNMTLKQYIADSVSQVSQLPLDTKKQVTGKEVFCGQELDYLEYTMNNKGMQITQKIYFTESGDRFVIFQFSAMDREVIDTMKGYFSEFHGEE